MKQEKIDEAGAKPVSYNLGRGKITISADAFTSELEVKVEELSAPMPRMWDDLRRMQDDIMKSMLMEMPMMVVPTSRGKVDMQQLVYYLRRDEHGREYRSPYPEPGKDVRKRAADVLRRAARWWEENPSRFLKNNFFAGDERRPVAMCSIANIAYHDGGGQFRGHPAEDITVVGKIAAEAVVQEARGGGHFSAICEINNDASGADEMIHRFRSAARNLERAA